MKLKDWISKFPKAQQKAERERLAEALGVAEITVRSYINGNRQIPRKYDVVTRLEQATGGAVTRYDERPDAFGPTPRPMAAEAGAGRSAQEQAA